MERVLPPVYGFFGLRGVLVDEGFYPPENRRPHPMGVIGGRACLHASERSVVMEGRMRTEGAVEG